MFTKIPVEISSQNEYIAIKTENKQQLIIPDSEYYDKEHDSCYHTVGMTMLMPSNSFANLFPLQQLNAWEFNPFIIVSNGTSDQREKKLSLMQHRHELDVLTSATQ